MPVLDFLHLDFTLLVQQSACLGSTALVFGLACFGSILFASDAASIGLATLLKSFVHPESLMPALDLLKLGVPTFARSFAQIDLSFSPFGLARAGSVFFLLAVDSTFLDSPLLLQSMAHMGFAMLALDFLHMGFTTSMHGLA